MPLFASRRDSEFMKSVNTELTDRIIGMEVLWYKLALEQSKSNIYDETTDKVYYTPVVLSAYVYKQPVQTEDTAAGLQDVRQDVTFGFLRHSLEKLSAIITIGDVFRWDRGFYEIDNVRKEDYWWGRNPEEFIAHERGVVDEQGWSYAVLADTHRAAFTSVNVDQSRTIVPRGTDDLSQTKGF